MKGSNTRFKLCSVCKTIIAYDNKKTLCDKCLKKQNKDKVNWLKAHGRLNETQKVYDSLRYKRARSEAMKRAHGLCEVCLELEGKRREGKEAHHIIKVKDGDDFTNYDINNLVIVCSTCHKNIEGLNEKQLIEYLIKNKK